MKKSFLKNAYPSSLGSNSEIFEFELFEWNYWWPSTCSCEVAVYVVRESNEEADKNEGCKLEECSCDVDIDCPFWLAQNEGDKYLYSFNTKEESDKFAKEELEEFKIMKNNESRKKRKTEMGNFKKPRLSNPCQSENFPIMKRLGETSLPRESRSGKYLRKSGKGNDGRWT